TTQSLVVAAPPSALAANTLDGITYVRYPVGTPSQPTPRFHLHAPADTLPPGLHVAVALPEGVLVTTAPVEANGSVSILIQEDRLGLHAGLLDAACQPVPIAEQEHPFTLVRNQTWVLPLSEDAIEAGWLSTVSVP